MAVRPFMAGELKTEDAIPGVVGVAAHATKKIFLERVGKVVSFLFAKLEHFVFGTLAVLSTEEPVQAFPSSAGWQSTELMLYSYANTNKTVRDECCTSQSVDIHSLLPILKVFST